MSDASHGPLVGKQVVITQAVHQAPEFAGILAARGAAPLLYPCIAIAPPVDPLPLDNALRCAASGEFDWLVLTSANAVLALAHRLPALGLATQDLAAVAVAAIGPATAAAALEHLGRSPELVPEHHMAEGLAAAITAFSSPGKRVLLPQADLARSVLSRDLAAAGLMVTQVMAYRTILGAGGVDLPGLLDAGAVDGITFTSGSTVQNLLTRLHAAGVQRSQLSAVCLACIGPVTAGVGREAGLTIDVVARTQSLEGLAEALASYWSKES
jgi:uroporphyrinogen III methyltransferase/synthase